MRLFGFGRTDDEVLAELAALKERFRTLLIEPSQSDCENAFESWGWVGIPKKPPILVSAFGDAFFETQGRVVMMLDTLEGALTPVARGVRELSRKLDITEQQDRLLSSVWVQAAQRQGLSLALGECYDWKVAPRLGGPISKENISKLSFVVKVNIAGQLHDQLRKLPRGTKINRITISN